MPLLHWRAPVGPALHVRPPQGRQARLYPVACWQRCSRAPLPFLATRAHCWLMYCPAGYPGHFLQSCFPVLKETRIQILFLKLGGSISYLVQFSNLENQVFFFVVCFLFFLIKIVVVLRYWKTICTCTSVVCANIF